jgi:hypothetical protein
MVKNPRRVCNGFPANLESLALNSNSQLIRDLLVVDDKGAPAVSRSAEIIRDSIKRSFHGLFLMAGEISLFSRVVVDWARLAGAELTLASVCF